MLRRLKLLVGIVGVYLFLALRLYAIKSWLYRAIFERRYRNIQLSTYQRYEDLVDVIRTLQWTADGPKELWDAISSPEKVEYVARYSEDKRAGDCDEFAIYIVATLNRSLAEGKFVGDPTLQGARFMTVTWMDKDGKYGGHNVALLIRDQGMYSYMDYGMPSTPRHGVKEVVQDVMDRYAPGGTVLVYGVSTENLWHVWVSR